MSHYDNIPLHGPDGVLIAHVNLKRKNWYLKKELATELPGGGVQLNFQPDGGPGMTVIPRDNQCVVCGTQKELTRHHAIPTSFRRHFPEELKSRRSEDILLLCERCHRNYNKHEEELRKDLTKGIFVPELSESLKSVHKAAMALTNHELPEKRRLELFFLIEDHLRRFVKDEDIARLNQEALEARDAKRRSTAADVVRKWSAAGELEEFIKLWRDHFIKTMKPRFLPLDWSSI